MPLAHQDHDVIANARVIADYRQELVDQNAMAPLLRTTDRSILGLIGATCAAAAGVVFTLGAALPLVIGAAAAALPLYLGARGAKQVALSKIEDQLDLAVENGEIASWAAAHQAGIVDENAAPAVLRRVPSIGADFPGAKRTTFNPAEPREVIQAVGLDKTTGPLPDKRGGF